MMPYFRNKLYIVVKIVLFIIATAFILGCGEDTPVKDDDEDETIETGISGTEYLNVKHGFRISNLPTSNWVIQTRNYRTGIIEKLLLMANTTQDQFTTDLDELVEKNIVHIEVSVYGPDPSLPSKPDLAKDIMDTWISNWEWAGVETLSRGPVAAINTTGYEAVLSVPTNVGDDWTVKWAFFAKHDRGYIIAYWAPKDEYENMLSVVEPIISNFRILGL
ncbi:hypothetical protein GF312_06410 [Candidatus Poribacteria bacterium]|nr:hypothetical protein [Candidatus Poribacteria bacterium]